MEINEELIDPCKEGANKAIYIADVIEKQLEDQNIPFAVMGTALSVLLCTIAAKKKMTLEGFINLCASMADLYREELASQELHD